MIQDAILFWNEVTLEVHRRDFTFDDAAGDDESGAPMDRQGLVPEQGGPTRASRALAMVHLAMYDAMRATDPTVSGSAYLPNLPAPTANASAEAATGAAAASVLADLFKRQTDFIQVKQDEWLAHLAANGQGSASLSAGASFGTQVGSAMIAARRNDGHSQDAIYVPLATPGTHRAGPYNPQQGFLHPHWGDVTPFGVMQISNAMFIPPLSDAGVGTYLNNPLWPLEVEEVRRLGAAQDYADLDPSTGERSAEETVIGLFWGYDGARGLGTPPRLYNQCVRSIAEATQLTPQENAVLFALINMIMADAGIAAWKEKYTYHVWRPVIGVREAAQGYGPGSASSPLTFNAGDLPLPLPSDNAGVANWLEKTPSTPTTGYNGTKNSDPFWRPLGAPQTNTVGIFHRTPNFPAYPSGHATFGTACFQTVFSYLEALGTKGDSNDLNSFEFTVVSDELNGKSWDPDGSRRSRHARTLTLAQAIHENAVSRIYLGVHWRMDAVEGVRLGQELVTTMIDEARGPAAIFKPVAAKVGKKQPA
jgi:hypothetical protein